MPGGSWLAAEERINGPGDPWLLPGNLALDGGYDGRDPTQDYRGHPDDWSSGFTIRHVRSVNTECGTALAVSFAACHLMRWMGLEHDQFGPGLAGVALLLLAGREAVASFFPDKIEAESEPIAYCL